MTPEQTTDLSNCLKQLEEIKRIENDKIQSHAVLETQRLVTEVETLKETIKKNSKAYEVLSNAVKKHVTDTSTYVAILQDAAKW